MVKKPKWTFENLLEIEPHEFEVLLSGLFSKMGYLTELTRYSRDRGIDLIIRIENFGLSHTWLVQAKRYSHSVGVKEIREYSSLKYRDRVDGVIIVSTSFFTKEAIEEAAEHNVKLIDGNLLIGMLEYYLPDEQNDAGYISEKQTERTSEVIGDGTILKSGEQVIGSETVMMGNEKFTLSITNKNLFFKRKSTGLFSKNSQIEEKIEVKKILGLHTEANRSILIIGNKELKLYPISSGKSGSLVEIFENLRPAYLKGEYLITSFRNGKELTMLTNKRLVVADIAKGILNDIDNKKIVGVEMKGGFLKKDQLIVTEDSVPVAKHSLLVDNPGKWKDMIEQCVRTL